MQINNLTKCSKPRFSGTFTGGENSARPRYKHYEQMSDDVLAMRSIIKAHKDVEQSGKMKLAKAMPSIALGILGTSLAIAQPGKLAKKAAVGLGFLALSETAKVIGDKVENVVKNKKENQTSFDKKKSIMTFAGSLASVALGAVGFFAVKKSNKLEPVKKFVSKEINQLSDEINATKVGKFVDEKINPFLAKHKKATTITEIVAPVATTAGFIFGQTQLLKSLSKDVKQKAKENFAKGKMIQEIARKEFDSIKAQEV